MMNSVNDIIEHLKNHSSEKYKSNVTKLGIPEDNSLGVPTTELRKLAKRIKPSNSLAKQLWNTQYHEAKLLSVLIIDVYTVDPKWSIALVDQVSSWDLCDHLCKNLLFKLPEYKDLIASWHKEDRLYHKRSAFVLIATAVLHDKEMNEDQVDHYLKIIQIHESDSRLHIRKAVSWALREIGKKDITSQKKAKQVAEELAQNLDKNKQWIGKDALREINQLVAIKGRKRLLSKNSKNGQLSLKQAKSRD